MMAELLGINLLGKEKNHQSKERARGRKMESERGCSQQEPGRERERKRKREREGEREKGLCLERETQVCSHGV